MARSKKLKRNTATLPVLPEEVINEEILTRLPIKSVVRFKSVSKSWQSWFSHGLFVKYHRTYSAENPKDYDCIIANKYSSMAILSRYKETCILYGHYQLVGSVYGLVCLRTYNDWKLSLWNPAIHQYKQITIPPRLRSFVINIGLGCDSVCDANYKVVVCYMSFDKRSATLYSSDTDSWIDISVPVDVFPKDTIPKSIFPSTTVKNCPYWTYYRYTSDKEFLHLIAVKFEVRSNDFKLLPEFRCNISGRGNWYDVIHNLVNMKDLLTLIVHDQNSAKCMVDVYSLQGEEGCFVWIKMYSLGPLNFHIKGSRLSVSLQQGFMHNDEIVVHDYRMISSFDLKTDTKCLLGESPKYLPFISCFSYTPTLAFLPGMKSVYSATQTRKRGICFRTPSELISSLID